MPWIGIYNVGEPDKGFPNVPFIISWRTFYVAWPFKKFTLFTTLEDSQGIILREEQEVYPLFFLGIRRYQKSYVLQDTETFIIKAGDVR